MTEAEWLVEQRLSFILDQLKKLNFHQRKAGQRKLRLFACGSVHLVWHLLPDRRLEDAVVLAEKFADGDGTASELQDKFDELVKELGDLASGDFSPEASGVHSRTAACMSMDTLFPKAYSAADSMGMFPVPLAGVTIEGKEGEQVLCDLLRCVFGNPFQKPAFSKKWRTETVTALASGIYEERAFDRLPILADALEEAGCDDPAMLSHLRGPGPHCRGCWVLDLALGK